MDFITELFGLRKEQRQNNKKILKTLSLIVGSIFIAEGIISLFPDTFEKVGLIGIGLILVIMSVLD